MNTEQLITDFKPTFSKIKKQYNFLELDDNIWDNLIVDHIISIAANPNSNPKKRKNIINYVKHTFLIKLTSYIKQEMDINDVINKFINYKLVIQEDKRTNILEIEKLSKFLTSLELELEINLLEQLFEQNQEIEKICNSIFDNNSEIKQSQIESFSRNILTVEILELFCTYKNIEIIDDTLEIIDNNDIDDYVFDEDADTFLINSIRKKNLPILTREEELYYFNQYKLGNAEARNILIERNQRLVVSIAKKFIGHGVELSDLIQEGNIGLITAIDKYDPTKGFRFSTYGTHWIKRAVVFAIGNQGKTIRIPLHQGEKIRKFNIIKNQMAQKLNREPTVEELAKELKVSIKTIKNLNDPNTELASLNMKIDDEHDTSLVDFIPDKKSQIEDNIFNETLKTDVHKMLEVCNLKDIERQVIYLRHGLYDGNYRTLEEIGNMLGKTRERIRQIEAEAFAKIRRSKQIGLVSDYINISDSQLKKIRKNDKYKS